MSKNRSSIRFSKNCSNFSFFFTKSDIPDLAWQKKCVHTHKFGQKCHLGGQFRQNISFLVNFDVKLIWTHFFCQAKTCISEFVKKWKIGIILANLIPLLRFFDTTHILVIEKILGMFKHILRALLEPNNHFLFFYIKLME